ncbi:polyadenylate-binding protein 7-like [Typha latifolia]|uniref:polyadenylate-binding protein 7-like n=1 Tax=Typha latifolia TaxID=4733 RepID=UPI003C2B1A7D
MEVDPLTALYVGDVHPDVAESQLFDLFSSVGVVGSVRICKDLATGRSLGYGYVNYIAQQDAMRAVEKLNHTLLYGKPIRIMWSNRNPDDRNSGMGNVFVKNLSSSTDDTRLQEIFSEYGTILSCKVSRDTDGKNRGYGFVQYDSQESAISAITKLNNSFHDGKQIYVAKFIKKSERLAAQNPEDKYTNLYMKNLDQDITEELIKVKFSEFGSIVTAKIEKDENGNSKGFGFCSFESADSAKRAREAMDGVQLGSKTLYVARAQKKSERQQILRRLYEEKRKEKIRKSIDSNVYIKNIDESLDDNALREHFSQCGNITSAKIMHDDKGISKGFGFVCYSTPEEAKKAVTTLHGQMFNGKPLYVAMAQRKEERQAQFQLRYAYMAGLAGPPAVLPAGYPPVYYTPPSVVSQVSPRQGLMYQPFGLRPEWRPRAFVPPSRPGFHPLPLPVMPNAPRQHRQNRGRMNGHMMPQPGQSTPYMSNLQQANHSMFSSKHSTNQQRSGQSKYMMNGNEPDIANGSMVQLSTSNSQGTEMLSSMLAAATPKQQKQMLGERLFPLVEKLKCDLAAKITGMLLEMDNSELLLLLESPESLAAKVEEAVQVLNLSKGNVGDQESLHSNYLSAEVSVN